MAFFKVRLGDKVYELDKITLGDARVLKRDFGLTDLENFDGSDVDTVVGLLTLAIAKTDGISIPEATKRAEDIDLVEFAEQAQAAADELEAEADPTQQDGDSGETGGPSKSGKSGKRPRTPGDPSSQKS